MVPPASAERLRRQPLPQSLSDASGRQDWSAAYVGRAALADRPNLGLLLRWEAALSELAAFRALPPAEVDRFVAGFETHVAAAIDALPDLERLATPALTRPVAGRWDARQTIFPFLVLKDGRPLAPAALQALYHGLQSGRRAVHLGQPVAIGFRDDQPIGALRLSLSARLVVEALTTPGGEAAVMVRAAHALDAAAGLARSA